MRPSCRSLRVTSARSAIASAPSRKEGSRAALRTVLPRTEGLKSWAVSRSPGRGGKKIPAASRAVALGFGVGDRAAPEVDRARLAPHDAGPPAGRAGRRGAEPGGLPLQEFVDGPPGHGAGGGGGHLLDVVGIEVQV